MFITFIHFQGITIEYCNGVNAKENEVKNEERLSVYWKDPLVLGKNIFLDGRILDRYTETQILNFNESFLSKLTTIYFFS